MLQFLFTKENGGQKHRAQISFCARQGRWLGWSLALPIRLAGRRSSGAGHAQKLTCAQKHPNPINHHAIAPRHYKNGVHFVSALTASSGTLQIKSRK
jgi:hypothetical protein